MDSFAGGLCDEWNRARVQPSARTLRQAALRGVASARRNAILASMSKPDQSTSHPAETPGEWTRMEDYLDLGRLWRRAGRRHRRRLRPRSEISAPSLMSLGMLPFVLLMAAMALLTVLFLIAALPVRHYPERPPAPPEAGTAPAGWLDG
jgi:hypothetical protein